jgi:hypothetical protein
MTPSPQQKGAFFAEAHHLVKSIYGLNGYMTICPLPQILNVNMKSFGLDTRLKKEKGL